MASQEIQNCQKTLKKDKVKELTLPNFKTYFKVTVMKAVGYWHKDRPIFQWNRIESPEINPNIYRHLIFHKAKNTQRRKDSLLNKWCSDDWIVILLSLSYLSLTSLFICLFSSHLLFIFTPMRKGNKQQGTLECSFFPWPIYAFNKLVPTTGHQKCCRIWECSSGQSDKKTCPQGPYISVEVTNNKQDEYVSLLC